MSSSFWDAIQAKYVFANGGDELKESELASLVSTNPIQHDYIITSDGRTVSAYDESVSIRDIFLFFRKRMPTIKFDIREHLFKPTTPAEAIATKFMVYNQLAGYLSVTKVNNNGACYLGNARLPYEKAEEWHRNGDTIH
jgi:hypothetical protein